MPKRNAEARRTRREDAEKEDKFKWWLTHLAAGRSGGVSPPELFSSVAADCIRHAKRLTKIALLRHSDTIIMGHYGALESFLRSPVSSSNFTSNSQSVS